MKNYYRVYLGSGHVHTPECLEKGFIGVDYDIPEDLTHKLPDEWRDFNRAYVPIMRQRNPDLSAVGAGLKSGALWTLSKGIRNGDIVLCRDAEGNYHLGEVVGGYQYAPGEILPHRRPVRWLGVSIPRPAMSHELKKSSGGPLSVVDLSEYRPEIERLMGVTVTSVSPFQTFQAADPSVIDPVAFAMEKHLEEFLVKNWSQIELSNDFTILEDQGEQVGQQFPTDAGPIDILAVSRDNKRLLVIELKRGRATDVVVGQALRYMGFVKEQIATPGQTVEGLIIALEDDQKLRWALSAVQNISFYRYEISFKLHKG
jgi:restriction system protein